MKKIICILLLFVLVTSLASCGVVTNHMTTGYLCIAELDGSSYMLSRFSKIYKIDFDNKTFSLVQNPAFDEDIFDNENELIYHYLLKLERDLNHRIGNSDTEEYDDNGNKVSRTPKIREYQHFLKKVREYKDFYNPKQLTLF